MLLTFLLIWCSPPIIMILFISLILGPSKLLFDNSIETLLSSLIVIALGWITVFILLFDKDPRISKMRLQLKSKLFNRSI